jgi:hypothetical protein
MAHFLGPQHVNHHHPPPPPQPPINALQHLVNYDIRPPSALVNQPNQLVQPPPPPVPVGYVEYDVDDLYGRPAGIMRRQKFRKSRKPRRKSRKSSRKTRNPRRVKRY